MITVKYNNINTVQKYIKKSNTQTHHVNLTFRRRSCHRLGCKKKTSTQKRKLQNLKAISLPKDNLINHELDKRKITSKLLWITSLISFRTKDGPIHEEQTKRNKESYRVNFTGN